MCPDRLQQPYDVGDYVVGEGASSGQERRGYVAVLAQYSGMRRKNIVKIATRPNGEAMWDIDAESVRRVSPPPGPETDEEES